jgi:hypothetical protein
VFSPLDQKKKGHRSGNFWRTFHLTQFRSEEGKFTSLVFDTGSDNGGPQGFTVIRFVNGEEYQSVEEVRVGRTRQVLGAN